MPKDYVLAMLLSFIFFLMIPLETNYPSMRWTDLHLMRWHFTTDGKIATCMHALTPPMTHVHLMTIWWTFGSVTPSFAGAFAPGGLHFGLCHAFL